MSQEQSEHQCPATQEERDRGLATALRYRAQTLVASNIGLATDLLRAAHGLLENSGGYDNEAGLWVINTDGMVGFVTNDFVGAEASFRKALAVAINLDGENSRAAAGCRSNLAQALTPQLRFAEAEAMFVQALADLEALRPPLAADESKTRELADLDRALADARDGYEKMKVAQADKDSLCRGTAKFDPALSAKAGSRWITDNYATLPVGECVAADSSGLVAHAPGWAELHAQLAERGIDQSSVTMAYIEAPGPALVRQQPRRPRRGRTKHDE